MAFGPKATWFVTASTDRLVRLHARDQATVLHAFEGHTASPKTLDVSPDGRFAASGDEDGWVRLWDVEARTALRAIRVSKKRVRRVHFGANGTLWITDGMDRVLRVDDLADGEAKTVLAAHPSHHELETSPDNRWLLVGGSEGVVRVHEQASLERVATLETNGPVTGLALGADGRLAVAHLRGGVGIWDLRANRCLAHRTVHEKRIFSIRWLPGGGGVVSGSADGTVRWLRVSNRAEAGPSAAASAAIGH